MSRIQQQPSTLFYKAARIIAWIHLAERPLTVDELLYFLAIKDGDKFLDLDGVPIRKSLLNCCQGLALIDQETSTARLVHYSLEEYLSRQDEIFGHTKVAWQSKIARTCLTFLKFPSRRAEATIEESGGTKTLLLYAARQWGHHLRKADDSPDVPLKLAIEYLYNVLASNPQQWHLLYRLMYSDIRTKNPTDAVLHAHIAAFFGSSGIMSHLISLCQTDPDAKDNLGRTPLWIAARYGHEAVVKLLLDTGKVDPDAKDNWGRTPLLMAANKGHEVVVKLLQSSIVT